MMKTQIIVLLVLIHIHNTWKKNNITVYSNLITNDTIIVVDYNLLEVGILEYFLIEPKCDVKPIAHYSNMILIFSNNYYK